MGAGAGPRKLDVTRSSMVRAHANGLWPHLTDVASWPRWLRGGRGGSGLEAVEPLGRGGSVDPAQPELGQRFRFRFTNGFEGEFQVTYWLEPAQVSLGLVRGTASGPRGLEGVIFDLDFFPQPDGSTKLWFGALLLLQPGFRPGLLARWPRRDFQAWVDGFHARAVAEGPGLAGEVRTRKQMLEAAGTRP